MKFAKYTFLVAGIYGLLILTPQYFLEEKNGTDFPPAITHPEYYYGFIGVALAFQILFLIIAKNPAKYQAMIIPSIIEKFSFVLALIVLFIQHRVGFQMLIAGSIDLILGTLFIAAYVKTSGRE
jgi:hypothetical protein